jgi:Flp pilus assembly pilin Flp
VSPTSSIVTDATAHGFALSVLKIFTLSVVTQRTDITVRGPISGRAQKQRGSISMNLFVLRTWLEAKFAKDERGASMVEYILLVALIALAVIAAVVFLKDQVNGKFNDAGSKLSSSGS